MDIVKHYEAYRASVSNDLFEEFESFCAETPTKNPARWPTVESFLKYAVSNIRSSKDMLSYKKALMIHKETVIQILEKMVEIVVSREPSYKREITVLNLAVEHGFNWFKFSRVTVTFNNLKIIPRYEARFMSDAQYRPLFDADEYELILATKSKSEANRALALKKKEGCIKIHTWDEHGFGFSPIQQVNNETAVRDWTLPLFPEDNKL
jgi:hypothetical protein